MADSFFLFFAAALALSSCSLKLHEPAYKPQGIVIRSESQACLKQTGSTVERFLEGKAEVAEIDQFWSCLDLSVRYFLKNTSGEDPNSYKPRELANFVGKYFLNGVVIPDSLLARGMRLKQGLFSGRGDVLTRAEIEGLLRLFSGFASASKIIGPYMPLSPASLVARANSDEKIEEAMNALDLAGKSLSGAMEQGLGTYSMADLSSLLAELHVFFETQGWSAKWISSIEPYLPVVASLKGIVIAPPKTEMLPADWLRLFELAPRYYAIYLRYQLYFGGTDGPELKGNDLYQLVSLLDRGMPLLESSMRNRNVPVINTEELDDLLDRLEELKLLSYPKGQLREVLALVLKRALPDPESKGSMRVSLATLKELRVLYSYFTDGLREIDGAFRKELGDSEATYGQIQRMKAKQLFPGNRSSFTVFNNDSTRVAIADLRANVEHINVSFDPRARMAVVPVGGAVPMSRFHLQRMHYLRTLNKILLRAYGDSSREVINQRQILGMLSDLEPIFRLFKIDSADLKKAVPARLFEASLFLPSSDGQPSLKMNEAIELESLFLSVIERAPKAHHPLAKACRSEKGAVRPDCYREAFAANLTTAWSNVPGLAAALKAVPEEDRIDLLTQLDGFLRKGKTENSYVEGDTKSLLLMGYYIELLFFRFDQNRDRQIDEQECRLAFPLFRPFIAKKAEALGRKDPAEHFKIFTYILAHRKVPQSFWEKLGYLGWKDDNAFTIDRPGTVEVLSTLLAL